MKYAHYDPTSGEIKGFYANDVHQDIPEPRIELTEEQWAAALRKPHKIVDGALQELPPFQPTYVDLRAAEYPPIVDQLDLLYHGGYDAWKAAIQAVKDKYPKAG
ncbi:MAG: hypothetical protein NBV65_02140 [Burkholderiaceae bacterium]|nr:hypothetical protein [Burkholderiaceae bacterium]